MLEERFCPHCKSQLEPWIAPPESGWGEILVCNNNQCPFFKNSGDTILYKDEDKPFGCRYAENPDNGYKPFNLLAWVGPNSC